MTKIERKIKALAEAVENAPEYKEVTPLFESLFRYMDGREQKTGISVTTHDNVQERIASGFPVISAADLETDDNSMATFLAGIIEILKNHGKGAEEYLDRLSAHIASGETDFLPLMQAMLERRRDPVDKFAQALDIPSPLIEYIFEIPLKASLESFADGITPGDVSGWQEPLCPVCGSRPGMAELVGEEGKRFLCCSTCSFLWPFKRLKCPSCGCEDPESLGYFTIGDGAVRVDTCKECSRYIKTRDSRKGNSDVPLDVEDLLSIHLDLLASREGFERGK